MFNTSILLQMEIYVIPQCLSYGKYVHLIHHRMVHIGNSTFPTSQNHKPTLTDCFLHILNYISAKDHIEDTIMLTENRIKWALSSSLMDQQWIDNPICNPKQLPNKILGIVW